MTCIHANGVVDVSQTRSAGVEQVGMQLLADSLLHATGLTILYREPFCEELSRLKEPAS